TVDVERAIRDRPVDGDLFGLLGFMATIRGGAALAPSDESPAAAAAQRSWFEQLIGFLDAGPLMDGGRLSHLEEVLLLAPQIRSTVYHMAAPQHATEWLSAEVAPRLMAVTAVFTHIMARGGACALSLT